MEHEQAVGVGQARQSTAAVGKPGQSEQGRAAHPDGMMANGGSGDGTVTIEYMRNAANQKEMAIAGGKLVGGTAEIDELFCFSFVMKDCAIHLASRHERDWSPSQYRKKHPDAEKNP